MDAPCEAEAADARCPVPVGTVLKNPGASRVRSGSIYERKMERRRPTALKAPVEKRQPVDRMREKEIDDEQTYPPTRISQEHVYREEGAHAAREDVDTNYFCGEATAVGNEGNGGNLDRAYDDQTVSVDGTGGESRDGRDTPDAAALLLELVAKEQELLALQQENEQLREDLADAANDGEADIGQLRAQFAQRLKAQQEAASAAAAELVQEIEAARMAAAEAERGREALQEEMLRAERALSQLIQQVDDAEQSEARLVKEVEDLRIHQREVEAALGSQLGSAQQQVAALREEKEAAERRYRRAVEAESNLARELRQMQDQRQSVEMQLAVERELCQFEAEKCRSEQVEWQEQLNARARETESLWQAERQRLMRDRAEEERLRELLKAADEELERYRRKEEQRRQELQEGAETEALLNQEIARLRDRHNVREKELVRQLEVAQKEVALLESETQLLKQTLKDSHALEKNLASTVEKLQKEVALKAVELDSQKTFFEVERTRLQGEQAEAEKKLTKCAELTECTRTELEQFKLEHAREQRSLQEQLQAAETVARQLRQQMVNMQRETDGRIAEISQQLCREIEFVSLQKAEVESAAEERVRFLETQVATLQRERAEAEQELQRRSQIEDRDLKDVEAILREREASDQQARQKIASLEAERTQLQRDIQKAEWSAREQELAKLALKRELANLQKRTAAQKELEQRVIFQEKELERLLQLNEPYQFAPRTHRPGGADTADLLRQNEAQQHSFVESLASNSCDGSTELLDEACRKVNGVVPPEKGTDGGHQQDLHLGYIEADNRPNQECSAACGSPTVSSAREPEMSPGNIGMRSGWDAAAAERLAQGAGVAGQLSQHSEGPGLVGASVASTRERLDTGRSDAKGQWKENLGAPVAHQCWSRRPSSARMVQADNATFRASDGRSFSHSYSETICSEADASPLSNSRKASASFHRASCDFLQQEVVRLSKAYTQACEALEEAQQKRRGDGQRLECLLLELEDGGSRTRRDPVAWDAETGNPEHEQESNLGVDESHHPPASGSASAQVVQNQEALQDLKQLLASEIGYAGTSDGVLRAAVSTLKTLLQRKIELPVTGTGDAERNQTPVVNSTIGLFYRTIELPQQEEKGEIPRPLKDGTLREWPSPKPVRLRLGAAKLENATCAETISGTHGFFLTHPHVGDSTLTSSATVQPPEELPCHARTVVQEQLFYKGSQGGGSEAASRDSCGARRPASSDSSNENPGRLQNPLGRPDLRLEAVPGQSRSAERTSEHSVVVARNHPDGDAGLVPCASEHEGSLRPSGTFVRTGSLQTSATACRAPVSEADQKHRFDARGCQGLARRDTEKKAHLATGGTGSNNEETLQSSGLCTTQFFSIADECVDVLALQQLLQEREDEVSALEDALEQSQRREATLLGRLEEAERLLGTLHRCSVAAEQRGDAAAEVWAALLSRQLHDDNPTVDLPALTGDGPNEKEGREVGELDDFQDSKSVDRAVRHQLLESDNASVSPCGREESSAEGPSRERLAASRESGEGDCKSNVDDICEQSVESSIQYNRETDGPSAGDGTAKSQGCPFCGLKASEEPDLFWLRLVRQAWKKCATNDPQASSNHRQQLRSSDFSLSAGEDPAPTYDCMGNVLPVLHGPSHRPAESDIPDGGRVSLVIPALPRHLTLCEMSTGNGTPGSNLRTGVPGLLSTELQFAAVPQMALERRSVRLLPADSSEALRLSNRQVEHAGSSRVDGAYICTSSTGETMFRFEVCMSVRDDDNAQQSSFLSVVLMRQSEDSHEDEVAAMANAAGVREVPKRIPIRLTLENSGNCDKSLFRLYRKHADVGVVEPSGVGWDSVLPNVWDAGNPVYLQHVGTQLFLAVSGIQLMDSASEATLDVLVRRARSANTFCCSSNVVTLDSSEQPKMGSGDDQPRHPDPCYFGTENLADATPFLLVSASKVTEREVCMPIGAEGAPKFEHVRWYGKVTTARPPCLFYSQRCLGWPARDRVLCIRSCHPQWVLWFTVCLWFVLPGIMRARNGVFLVSFHYVLRRESVSCETDLPALFLALLFVYL
ncbi:hypothetical protein TGRUB_210270 [Toxoplasma gondii RUB]|uniref:Uncharacterized protein n=1 Tax=Toxoplasma gondii RUB TaxID=935652 RepID=A0A086M248_TOXGO|nr:hypothetical protein TGRUB_210270 [Toxoplasma gondii RUB]